MARWGKEAEGCGAKIVWTFRRSQEWAVNAIMALGLGNGEFQSNVAGPIHTQGPLFQGYQTSPRCLGGRYRRSYGCRYGSRPLASALCTSVGFARDMV